MTPSPRTLSIIRISVAQGLLSNSIRLPKDDGIAEKQIPHQHSRKDATLALVSASGVGYDSCGNRRKTWEGRGLGISRRGRGVRGW
jgi:hypothetical protein